MPTETDDPDQHADRTTGITIEDVRPIIAQELGLEDRAVRPDAHFLRDLGCDSLDAVEVVLAVEERFGVEITDDDMDDMLRVSDLLMFLNDYADPDRHADTEGEGPWTLRDALSSLDELISLRVGEQGKTDEVSHFTTDGLRRLRDCLDRLRGAREGEGPRCEKCGSDDLSTRWKPEVEKSYERGYKGCRNLDEHLHRVCRNCQYEWDDPPRTALHELEGGDDADF